MYNELVCTVNVVKSFTKICFAPTCIREEPNKVHSSISILEPATKGKKIQMGQSRNILTSLSSTKS